MNVRYLGHASFRVASTKGTVVVLDPYGTHIPYEFPPLDADVVVISHEHRDHNADFRVNGNPMIIKRTHDFQCENELTIPRTGETLTFHGIPTHHDNYQGRKRGPNTVWHWFWEGIHFAHLGDLGHILTDMQQKIIGKVDVVFLPVGGKETIDPTEAVLVINQLEPKIVFPMHYKTPQVENHDLCEFGIEDFTSKMSNVEDAATMATDVELARLPSETKVIILRHA
ncbi:MAG: MBL fold metallo-hydrolase [Candidatus Eremiobacteraeota bacterium]|nr:MBL fold metallo-hydrolase [Candidatus Eremiobacteraeota bacterium]